MIKKTTKKIDATALQALRVRRLEAAMAALWSALVVPVGAFGGPQGGNVVEGVAQVQPITPTLTNIRQTTDRAVIEWQSFSIEKGERVNFEQPKATSAVLNRVIGLDPSTIAGELSANGQVFLVNPAGILFKNGAKIDTHSFVGAVADITNTNFMSGKLVFDEFDAQRSATATIKLEADASILARGSAASAGLAALVAPGVENAGVIEARLGQVIIGGAQRFTLDLTGDGLYSFAVDDGVVESLVGASGSAAVSVAESGRIVAKGGLVLLSAGVASDFIGDAINLEGHVFARSVSVDSKGEVVLDSCAAGLSCGGVSVGANAVIDAAGAEAGQSGGSIRIVGEDVALEARAELIASGEKDGGRIAIEAGSTLASSADLFTNGGTGLGGTIDIRSSGAVDVSGTLSAAGNNGTVAVTVAGEIDFSAAVTAKTFDIESTSASPLVIADEEGIRSQSVGDALLRGANTTLWSSSDVTIEGDVIGRNDGGSGAGSLTIDAGGDIAIASGVSVLTQGGALRLNASGNVSAAPSSTVGSDEGQVEIVAAGDVRLGQVAAGGTLDVRTTSGDIFITRSIGSAEAPEQTPSAISLTASAGDIVIMHPSVTENTRPEERLGLLTEAGSGHGSINARAFGQIIVNGQIVAAGNVTLHADRISLRQSIFTKGGDILIKAPGGIELDPSGRAEETFAREGLENILSNEDGRYEEIENYDCKARGGCVLGANGETVPVFQELSIRSRGLTISTGDTGAGTISFLGPVDIPSRLQDWRNSDDEHALRWTRTGADGELVYRGATEGPDPSLYYVTLTLEAESTSFMDGLAAGRKPVLSESSGDTPSAVGDGFNSVELVLLRGDLLAGAPDPSQRALPEVELHHHGEHENHYRRRGSLESAT